MSNTVRDSDYRALMKLAGETAELPQDVNARRKHLIGGLCSIVGGSMANSFEFRTSGPGGIGKFETHVSVGMSESAAKPIRDFLDRGTTVDPTIPHLMTLRSPQWCVTRQQFVTDAEWYRSDHYFECRAPIGSDFQLYSKLNLKDGTPLAVGIHRGSRDRQFGQRECDIVNLFHSECGGLYGGALDKPALDPRISQLPPRVQRVLKELTSSGDGEKQIALRLGLSRHTVHEYVKVLYEKLGVTSRAELMSVFASNRAVAAPVRVPSSAPLKLAI
jgi:DNA-binding CsgD family transcriptional regulator